MRLGEGYSTPPDPMNGFGLGGVGGTGMGAMIVGANPVRSTSPAPGVTGIVWTAAGASAVSATAPAAGVISVMTGTTMIGAEPEIATAPVPVGRPRAWTGQFPSMLICRSCATRNGDVEARPPAIV